MTESDSESKEKAFGLYLKYASVVSQAVVLVVIPALIGHKIDSMYNTKPIWLAVASLIGVVGAVLLIIKNLNK